MKSRWPFLDDDGDDDDDDDDGDDDDNCRMDVVMRESVLLTVALMCGVDEV